MHDSCKLQSWYSLINQGLWRALALLISILTSAVAAEHPKQSNEKIRVVASFSILRDVVQNIGGKRVDLREIVGPNADTHIFNPTPETSKLILGAKIVFINGLGFESWFTRLIEAAGYQGTVIEVSGALKELLTQAPSSKVEIIDPHVWGDVQNVIQWCHRIAEALIELDPGAKPYYLENLKSYTAKLKALDRWIKNAYGKITQSTCKVITSHDAFGYYGRAYGVDFLAPSGLSTEDEPSAAEMVELIELIRKIHLKTIFVENISSQHLIKQLSLETGAKIGGPLFSDALSNAEQGGGTYIDMMVYNTRIILESLDCFGLPEMTLKNPQ